VHAHPEWLLRPDGVRYLDPAGGSDWEGIYIDPTIAAARSHTVSVFEDIVRRYAVEGFHHDYIRYPQVGYAASPDDHAAITALVRETARRVRAARPGIVISAAVFPDPTVARERVLQRWPEWAAERLVDRICPMAYRTDTAEVHRLLDAARAAAPTTPMWGGLMAYAGERARARDQVRAARDAGCEGVIHFNNAGAALQPAPVLAAVRQHLDLEAQVGGYEAAEMASGELDDVYRGVAELVGANPGEIALMESATRGLDAVLYSLPLEPGDRIHASTHEYASSFIALLQLITARLATPLPLSRPQPTSRPFAVSICQPSPGGGKLGSAGPWRSPPGTSSSPPPMRTQIGSSAVTT